MPQSLRVVVADDEPEMVDFYRAILAHLGHTVLAEARNGNELVEHCRKHEPDLVVSDIAMPGIDGITAMHRLGTCSNARFIFVTGNEDVGMRIRAQQRQVLAYLMKPIKRADLASTIGRFRE